MTELAISEGKSDELTHVFFGGGYGYGGGFGYGGGYGYGGGFGRTAVALASVIGLTAIGLSALWW